MAGELGPAHPPDRQRIGAVAGRVLLAKPAPPYRLVQRRGEIRPAPQHLVMHHRRAAQLAEAALLRLADAEQRDDIAAVGVKPQQLIGQGAGIGGQKHAGLPGVGQRAVTLADTSTSTGRVIPRHIADLAHDLAGAVRVHQTPDVPAQPGIEQLQFVEAVTPGFDAAQQHQPAPVFQLGADRLGERREGGQREIRCRHLFPPHTAGPCRGKRAVDLGELRRRQVPLPARRARHLAAAPHAGAGHRPDLRHVTPRSSLCSGLLLPRLYRPRINRLAPEISSRTSTIRRNAWSSSLPNSCSPAQVPTASAGRPIRNNTSVSWPTMPAPPSHSAVIANTATPEGWNPARCSGGGQPRRLHQITAAMPASPVAPPMTPLTTPTAPSATTPARAIEPRLGRNKFHRLKITRIAPTAMRRWPGAAQRSNSAPGGSPTMPPIRNAARRGHLIARRNFHTETPCTIRPNATISGVACAGAMKCSQTAAAMIANAKPASPVTNAAAKAPTRNSERSSVENPSMAYPILARRVCRAAGDGATLADRGG